MSIFSRYLGWNNNIAIFIYEIKRMAVLVGVFIAYSVFCVSSFCE
jgi:hypothetical protein